MHTAPGCCQGAGTTCYRLLALNVRLYIEPIYIYTHIHVCSYFSMLMIAICFVLISLCQLLCFGSAKGELLQSCMQLCLYMTSRSSEYCAGERRAVCVYGCRCDTQKFAKFLLGVTVPYRSEVKHLSKCFAIG